MGNMYRFLNILIGILGINLEAFYLKVYWGIQRKMKFLGLMGSNFLWSRVPSRPNLFRAAARAALTLWVIFWNLLFHFMLHRLRTERTNATLLLTPYMVKLWIATFLLHFYATIFWRCGGMGWIGYPLLPRYAFLRKKVVGHWNIKWPEPQYLITCL